MALLYSGCLLLRKQIFLQKLSELLPNATVIWHRDLRTLISVTSSPLTNPQCPGILGIQNLPGPWRFSVPHTPQQSPMITLAEDCSAVHLLVPLSPNIQVTLYPLKSHTGFWILLECHFLRKRSLGCHPANQPGSSRLFVIFLSSCSSLTHRGKPPLCLCPTRAGCTPSSPSAVSPGSTLTFRWDDDQGGATLL